MRNGGRELNPASCKPSHSDKPDFKDASDSAKPPPILPIISFKNAFYVICIRVAAYRVVSIMSSIFLAHCYRLEQL